MAKIVNYTKGNSYMTNTIPTEVNCIYNTQKLYNGSKMLVIKTYNPKSVNGGISQTIHFTKESALELIAILKKELDL